MLVVLILLIVLVALYTKRPIELFEVVAASDFQVVAVHPHDPTLFTQGLVWSTDGQVLYESSGLYGRSFLQASSPLRREALDPTFFAEDITLDPRSGDLLQLTWREGRVLRWDPTTLKQKESNTKVPTPSGEGWGITADTRGTLFVSDGSATLTVVPPTSLLGTSEPIQLRVRGANGHPVSNINALAYSEAEDALYANVWKTTNIVVIDPKTGFVRRTLDVTEFVPESAHMNAEAVTNGLAFHPKTGHLWLTGKLWDRMYEVRV